jgi:hypothetical protein
MFAVIGRRGVLDRNCIQLSSSAYTWRGASELTNVGGHRMQSSPFCLSWCTSDGASAAHVLHASWLLLLRLLPQHVGFDGTRHG